MEKLLTTPNGIASIVFFAFFLLASISNIVFSFLDMLKARAISKPFCMSFLALSSILALPTNWLIYVGAICGLIGDVVYLFKSNKKCVLIGAMFFFLGHVSYLAQVLVLLGSKGLLTSSTNWYAPVFVVISLLAFIPYMLFLTGKKKMFSMLGSIYGTTIMLYLVFSIYASFCGPQHYFAVVAVGALLFIVSDSYLVYGMFNKKTMKKRNFIVMLTYLSAQACIVTGLVLTILNG